MTKAAAINLETNTLIELKPGVATIERANLSNIERAIRNKGFENFLIVPNPGEGRKIIEERQFQQDITIPKINKRLVINNLEGLPITKNNLAIADKLFPVEIPEEVLEELEIDDLEPPVSNILHITFSSEGTSQGKKYNNQIDIYLDIDEDRARQLDRGEIEIDDLPELKTAKKIWDNTLDFLYTFEEADKEVVETTSEDVDIVLWENQSGKVFRYDKDGRPV